MSMIVKDISFSYSKHKILNKICFEVKGGDCVAVLGTNGVGKSTLLKCLNKVILAQSGEISIKEKTLKEMSGDELAKLIGYVPQNESFSDSTVFDAVLLGRKPYIKWDVTKNDLEIAENVINALSLDKFSLRKVNRMSGGEMQKVAIARALAQQPLVLLFDEPTSNLDLKNQLEVIQIIKDIVREKQISAIVTMHDLNLALRFADKFLMMKEGKIYATGGKEIITRENILEVYGVDVSIENFNGYDVVIPN
ncbi:ABC transporter ATP-binding protein [Anaerovorax odorimutans]|uniref:ABC transporter ATP-binding protein n=1 Tax=Anaerovorax odorimutans TaxID=109327 RepID=UPI0004878B1B|nr:ABC transporter ATP-binding protein [Anaerovorax odorimutans]